MRFASLLLLLLLSTAAGAQIATDRDVVLDGESVVGRWTAVEVPTDPGATADLARGTLTTVLVINPTGHVILRGTDTRQGRGAPAAFSGAMAGRRVVFRELPGTGELARYGRELHLVDPRGRRTVFVRSRR
ncbi:hypothetical protein [Rubrivirga sp.]|uniref:hypothetical protein n=1 Tax=Rubrivirga sp. TaxID=1885344 RepID=UPI003C78E42D